MSEVVTIKILICRHDYEVTDEIKEENYCIFQALPKSDKFFVIKDIFNNSADIITFDELSRRIKRYTQ